MGFHKGIDYISYRSALGNGFDKEIDYISHCSALRNGFDKEIDYLSHRYALPWVLIRELIIFLIVMPCDRF